MNSWESLLQEIVYVMLDLREGAKPSDYIDGGLEGCVFAEEKVYIAIKSVCS